MRNREQSTPPPWNEADSIRETTLIWLDDPRDRKALRRVGRLIYDLATEVTRKCGTNGESSSTRAALRAIAADLRYTAGYCASVGREAEESSLPAADATLARYAGQIAVQVGVLAVAIEEALS